ncbi:MAG: beta-lactamase family protein [Flavobacteriales bacterium]|nr:beta-lactamase family protein [Flavobacteriales bacterium]
MKLQNILGVLLVLFHINISAQVSTEKTKQVIDSFSKGSNNTAVLYYTEHNGAPFTYASGISDHNNNIEAKQNDLFEIGSATKMFTAIAVLKLIEDGKISLNTKISEFYKGGDIINLGKLKGENHFNEVSIEMLLNHTSGFIDYLNVYDNDEKAMEIFAIEGKTYSFDELISLAVNHGDANFAPGEKFKYCNTGYVILGDIISKVSKEDWRDYIQKNILNKANMKNTFFGTRISKSDEKRKMLGYYNGKYSFMPASLAGSAGEIVSSLEDLNLFLKAWQGAKFFSQKTLEMQRNSGYHQMYEGIEMLKYGYGSMRISGFYGHGGQTFGFQTYVTYNPETKKAYIIATNDASVSAMTLFIGLEEIPLGI